MQVAKWGNSLAIRLPVKLVAELGLKEGDEVIVRRADDGALEVGRKPSADELFEQMLKFRGSLPADYKFDRGQLYERREDDAE
jgi:antitoxin MazE